VGEDGGEGDKTQKLTPTLALPPQAGSSTHLTQGAEDVIRGTCMFVVNIFPNPFWIGFKRLSEESLLFLDSICREGFVNG
jgi:hypothetical protein